MKRISTKFLVIAALLAIPHAAMSESRLAPGPIESPLFPRNPKPIDPIALTPAAATGVVVTAVLVARADVAPGLGETCDTAFDVDASDCAAKPTFPRNPKF